MYDKASSTVTPTMVITATNISGSQYIYMFPVIFWFSGPPLKLTGGRFTTGIDLSTSVLYFVNRKTGIWSAPSFTNAECDSKETSVDEFST